MSYLRCQMGEIQKKLDEIADNNPNAYFVAVDGFCEAYCSNIKRKYPERFIAAGISEQNALSIAAGLAITGKLVYVMMLGFYSYCRAFDQLKLDIGYNNANVKIIGHGNGMWGAGGGYSHFGIEDIALLRTIPNLQIFSPSSEQEVDYFMDYSATHYGPMFIRVDEEWLIGNYDNVPVPVNKNPQFNKFFKMIDGQDCVFLATGMGLFYAYHLARKFNALGIFPMIVSVTTLKPFDYDGLQKLIDLNVPVVTIEEHSYGGMAAIVGEYIAKLNKAVPFFPIYVQSEKFNCTGSRTYLFEKLSNIHQVEKQLLDYIKGMKLPFALFYKKFTTKKDNVILCSYKVLGLTLFQKKYTYKNDKVKVKSYLFGLIRI